MNSLLKWNVELLVGTLLVGVSLGDVACNYVKFNADVEYSFLSSTLGTFSFSTDRCQSLRAHIDLNWYDEVVDGSMLFTCSNDGKTLKMKVYDDPTCTNFVDSVNVKTNDSIKLFEYVKFHIDELHCDLVDCDVGFTFTQNCSWLNSDLYLNVSLPPEQCLSFGADFQGILSSLPDEVLPDDVVTDLQQKSFKYTCCDDNSLLIYNYTDTTCKEEKNMIRISSDYNGTCFKVGNTDWYDTGNKDDDYKFVLQWKCANYANCDAMGIDFLDDSIFPDECSKTCLDGLDWDGTGTTSHHKSDDSDSSSENSGQVTVTKEAIIGIAVGVLLLFMFSLIAVYCITRRRRIQRELERQEEIIVSPEKYAPMIGDEGDDDDDNIGGGGKKSKFSKISQMAGKVVGVKGNKNGDNNDSNTEIVYGNDNNNNAGGVQHTSEDRPVPFASMTIDDVVQQDEINDNISNADEDRDIHDDIADVEPLNQDDNNNNDNVVDAQSNEQNGIGIARGSSKGNGHIPLQDEEDDE